jgi:glycosidase
MSWKNKVIYQIYPRSFMDSNGNGTGDLHGIQKKIDYIKQLGVDYVWISPFFESPQKDFGYDVSDYRKVDNLFGSNEDLKKLLEKFHDANLKMIIDLVISHTSGTFGLERIRRSYLIIGCLFLEGLHGSGMMKEKCFFFITF